MRLVLQTNNFTEEMKNSNLQFYQICKINEVISNGEKYKLDKALILADVSREEFTLIKSFFHVNEMTDEISTNLFSYFKNNAENVKKHRQKNRNKVMVKEIVKEEVKNIDTMIEEIDLEEKIDKRALNKEKKEGEEGLFMDIMNLYNDDFGIHKGIQRINDISIVRRKNLRKFFKDYVPKDQDPFDFLRDYYKLLISKNFHLGYPGTGKPWKFDYIHSGKCYEFNAT